MFLIKCSRIIFFPFESLLNKIYSSRYNPLYYSAQLIVLCLLIMSITGVYLLFFYKISAPYESIQNLHSQVYLGRWIRTFHRYAANMAMVFIFFHFLRVLIEGKTWGRRTLAWISGFLLLFMFLVTGWVGYILVWDEQAQIYVFSITHLLDSIPIFKGSLSQGFSGIKKISPSFFFVSVFFHASVPLGILFLTWIHTSRMKEALWLPPRMIIYFFTGAVLLVSIIFPAPLLSKFDSLQIIHQSSLDLIYGFWVPFAFKYPLLLLFICLLVVGGFFSAPLWSKPKKEKKLEPAYNDPKQCEGCSQCVVDCPYEAIEMFPRPEGSKGSPKFAVVDPSICVSCGICAASCASFTIGPPGRKSPDQLRLARDFIADTKNAEEKTLIFCTSEDEIVASRIKKRWGNHENVCFLQMDCLSNIHLNVLDQLARRFKNLVIIHCPESFCSKPRGIKIFKERFEGKREPTLPDSLLKNKIITLEIGCGEEGKIDQALEKIGIKRS